MSNLHSHKLEIHAAKALHKLYAADLQDLDAWNIRKDSTWIEALCVFFTRCTKAELKRIVALSGVSLSYAYDCLFNVFHNADVDFPVTSSVDLALAPKGLLF